MREIWQCHGKYWDKNTGEEVTSSSEIAEFWIALKKDQERGKKIAEDSPAYKEFKWENVKIFLTEVGYPLDEKTESIFSDDDTVYNIGTLMYDNGIYEEEKKYYYSRQKENKMTEKEKEKTKEFLAKLKKFFPENYEFILESYEDGIHDT